MPSIKLIVHYGLIGCTYMIRSFTVSLSLLLVIRSATLRFFPVNFHHFLRPLYGITELFIIPVRQVLPEKTYTREIDFSPLVTAIIILLIGLGMEELINSFETFLNY